MFQSVDFYDFERAFVTANRNDDFSYQAKRVLFDYLEEIEESTGEQIELDVVALCCEYNEVKYSDFIGEYSQDFDGPEYAESESDAEYDSRLRAAIHEYLNENTVLCGHTDDSVVFQAF